MKTRVWNEARNATKVYGVDDLSDVMPRARQTALRSERSHLSSVASRTKGPFASVLCLDVSGSQAGPMGKGDNRPKIAANRESATAFVVNAPSNAQVAVIAFSDTADLLVPLSDIQANKLAIVEQIQQLQSLSTTAMHLAFDLGYDVLSGASGQLRFFMQTDGLPDAPQLALQAADRLKHAGIQITMIGFGDGHHINESFMQQAASVGADGRPLYCHFRDRKAMTAYMTKATRVVQ